MKLLSEIAWNVSEPVYRKDKAISYSTLSKYEREGFNALFEGKLTTQSLTYGSIVDTIVTDGWDAFKAKYYVTEIKCSNLVQNVFTFLATNVDNNLSLEDIPQDIILSAAKDCGYGKSWKDSTILQKLLVPENSQDYLNLRDAVKQCDGKEIISYKLFMEAKRAVDALHNSNATRWYFENDTDDTQHYYQLKFKGTLAGVDYRCMADLIIVLPNKKQIIPCDLKTTGHPEIMFWDSFHKWYYFYQAKLYWNLIRQNMDKDDYFKDFELLPYKFIVVNKSTLNPMVYSYDELLLEDYTYNGITYRNPLTVGNELKLLLDKRELEMNKELTNSAFDKIHEGLLQLKEALNSIEIEKPQVDSLKTIAKTVANTYKTSKADLGVDALYKNIVSMAKSDKYKILLKWMDDSPIEYIKTWRQLPIQEQATQLQEAVTQYSNDIKEVLDRKYGVH